MALIYLSQLLGSPVLDRGGERVGRLKDLIVRFGEDIHPPVIGIIARVRRRDFFLAWKVIEALAPAVVRLGTYQLDLKPYARRENEVLLAKDILDKQLIDIDGRRIVRANDVELAFAGSQYRLVAVDVSLQGLLRRLAPQRLGQGGPPTSSIDWAQVEYLPSSSVQLKVSSDRLARLHAVELAKLIDGLSYVQGADIVEALDDAKAADTLEEMPTERQADILEGIPEERAADILEEMGPDEAADVLADLPEDKAKHLLDLMRPSESQEVQELLAYPEDSAGGLMTTAFVTVPESLTVGEALDRIRTTADKADFVNYVYLTGPSPQEILTGIVTIRALLLTAPSTPLETIAIRDPLFVWPSTPGREVARLMAEYNLLASPVVDDVGRILGIVTVDDAMDLILPGEWRHQLPKVLG